MYRCVPEHFSRCLPLFRACLVLAACAPMAVALAAGSEGVPPAGEWLRWVSQSPTRPASWVSADNGRVAFGSGRHVALAGWGAVPVVQREFDLPFEASQAVLYGNALFVSAAGEVRRIDLAHPSRTGGRIELGLDGATVRIGRMTEHLLAATSAGLHLVWMPPPGGPHKMPGHAHHEAMPAEPTEVAFLPLAGRPTAVTGTGQTIFVALAGQGVVRIDARDALAPRLVGTLPIPGEIRALAADGERLLVLTAAELQAWDVADLPSPRLASVPEPLKAKDLELTGRLLLLAEGSAGLSTMLDAGSGATTHVVTVTSNVFTPDSLTIQVGDTVEWRNMGGFHDTQSCSDGRAACDPLGVATESWDSGAPGFGWTFSHTFTLVGENPYTCTVHEGFPAFMDGMIIVEGAPPAAPPAVPDGSDGALQPVTFTKLDGAGNDLRVAWDDTLCSDAVENQIIYGGGSQLPSSLGGIYELMGSRCSVPLASPFDWIGTPDPLSDPTRMIWMLMLANDGAGTEGSWGSDSSGGERTGPGAGGASNECTSTNKDLTNTCG